MFFSVQDIRAQVKRLFSNGLSITLIRSELKKDGIDPLPSRPTISRWCQRFKSGDPSLENRPRPGQPKSVTDETHVAKVKAVVEKDRRLLLREISEKARISVSSVWRILHFHLGLSLCSARWIPKVLTPEQKKFRVQASQENLNLLSMDKEFFLGQIVTGDETYLHRYEAETKRQSSQWLTAGAQPPLKAIRKTSSAKIMMVVFWDRMGVLLTEFYYKGATLTGQAYANTIGRLKKAYIEKRGQNKWDDGVFLLHDNAPCHTSKIAKEKIRSTGFIELYHPPYSPDLAPSDYFLFPKLKNYMRGRKYNSDEQVRKSAIGWLGHRDPSFFSRGISALEARWNKCVRVKGEYIEKIK